MAGQKRNILGVLGGMGPLATACFYRLIVEHTQASTDSDHLDLMISGRASLPDRTAFILEKSKEDPLPFLLAELEFLKHYGVTCVAIPCNTAYYWYEKLAQQFTPIINMVLETARFAARDYKKVGIMATEGTVQAAVLQKPLEEAGLEVVLPNEKQQAGIMDIIYSQVKKGQGTDLDSLFEIAGDLKRRGSEAVILGCTELSIVNQREKLGGFFIDPLEILAYQSILACGGQPINFPQLQE